MVVVGLMWLLWAGAVVGLVDCCWVGVVFVGLMWFLGVVQLA